MVFQKKFRYIKISRYLFQKYNFLLGFQEKCQPKRLWFNSHNWIDPRKTYILVSPGVLRLDYIALTPGWCQARGGVLRSSHARLMWTLLLLLEPERNTESSTPSCNLGHGIKILSPGLKLNHNILNLIIKNNFTWDLWQPESCRIFLLHPSPLSWLWSCWYWNIEM